MKSFILEVISILFPIFVLFVVCGFILWVKKTKGEKIEDTSDKM